MNNQTTSLLIHKPFQISVNGMDNFIIIRITVFPLWNAEHSTNLVYMMWVSGYSVWNGNGMDVRRQRALHSHPHTAAAKATLSLFCPRRPAFKTLFFFLVLRMLLQLLLALPSSLSERGDTTTNPAALWVLGEEDSTWDAIRRTGLSFLSTVSSCFERKTLGKLMLWGWPQTMWHGRYRWDYNNQISWVQTTKLFFKMGTQQLIHQEQWESMFRRFSINNIQVT